LRPDWTALAERCLPRAVVNAFAEAFKATVACETGQGLRNGGEGKVGKVFEPPKTFAFPLQYVGG